MTPKIMDFGNTKQSIVAQQPDGTLKIDQKAPDLEELW